MFSCRMGNLYLCIFFQLLILEVLGNCETCLVYGDKSFYCPSNIGCLKQSPQIGCHCNDMSLCRVSNDCYTWKTSYSLEFLVRDPVNETSRLTFSSCEPPDPMQKFIIPNFNCTSKYTVITLNSNRDFGIAVEGGQISEGVPVICARISNVTYSKKWIYDRNNLSFSPLGDPSLCMTAYNSQNLTLTQCSGLSSQKWYVIPDENSGNDAKSYRILSISASACLSAINYGF